MKRLLFAIAKVMSELYVLAKGIVFPIFANNKIKITKETSFYLANIGIMPKWLFQVQHLVGTSQGFETKTVELFTKLLKPGHTVLDIGANIGIYSLLSSKLVGQKGQVYSFEPVKNTFQGLISNVNRNKTINIKPYKIALSDSNGTVAIGAGNEHTGKKDQDLYNHLIFDAKSDSLENVDTLKLDDFILNENITKIDFIKIDVEGAELLVFRGGRNTLQKYKPIIILESENNFTTRFGYSTFDVLMFLYDLGYKFECYEQSQWLCTSKES